MNNPNYDIFYSEEFQKEALKRVQDVTMKINELEIKENKSDKEKNDLTKLYLERMLRGLYINNEFLKSR